VTGTLQRKSHSNVARFQVRGPDRGKSRQSGRVTRGGIGAAFREPFLNDGRAAPPARHPRDGTPTVRRGQGAAQAHAAPGGKLVCVLAGMGLLVWTGCRGIPAARESQLRNDLASVTDVYQPGRDPQTLPTLDGEAGLESYLLYAMLNDPRVRAAYFDWAATVERVTQARSLPDPRLTFQMDIRQIVSSVMPGVMQEFPGPGKLRLRAEVATAESEARYHRFVEQVLRTANDLKQAYYQLYFLEETLRVNREMLRLLRELEAAARAQNEAGRGTLQDVLRAQIEQDRIETEIENLEDSRHPLLARFSAALGLPANAPPPPLPKRFETTPLDLDAERLLARAYELNPRLRAMAAEVARAESALRLAYKSRVPDFSLGLMADVRHTPWMFRPEAGMTLPLWRDKIAAEIAQAQAEKGAAEARLSAEEIALAVALAERIFKYRESERNLKLLQQKLIPKARQSLEVARTGYLSGRIDFFNLIDAERTLLNFRLAEVEARLQRERGLAELSLVLVGIVPEGAPVLPARGPTTFLPEVR